MPSFINNWSGSWAIGWRLKTSRLSSWQQKTDAPRVARVISPWNLSLVHCPPRWFNHYQLNSLISPGSYYTLILHSRTDYNFCWAIFGNLVVNWPLSDWLHITGSVKMSVHFLQLTMAWCQGWYKGVVTSLQSHSSAVFQIKIGPIATQTHSKLEVLFIDEIIY